MGSSGQSDRSLGSGLSFPQWMKGKVDSRFDFDQSTFSPPSHDDSFLYIRYKAEQSQVKQQEGFQPISAVLSEQKSVNDAATSHVNTNVVTVTTSSQISNVKSIQEIDFSKHPRPCQDFAPVIKSKDRESSPPAYSINKSTKSHGIDDGFHGERARCGKSIVHVANRIMSSALGNKKIDIQPDNTVQMEHTKDMRRGSRSLPVSPISTPISTPDNSPKSTRRRLGGQQNRFFTGAFIPDRDKYHGGWILSGLINQSRDIVGNKISEEEDEAGTGMGTEAHIASHRPLSRKKSISSQNLSYFNKDKVQTDDTTTNNPSGIALQAQPSELREMNFWSPTSM